MKGKERPPKGTGFQQQKKNKRKVGVGNSLYKVERPSQERVVKEH